jgi:hypothetical protein
MTHAITLLAAYLLAVIATARATRLITWDSWPPVLALRLRFLTWTGRTEARDRWSPIATCPFCVAPWIGLVVVAVAVVAQVWRPNLGTLAGWWWLLAVWASLSYLASMVVVRDEPPEPLQ